MISRLAPVFATIFLVTCLLTLILLNHFPWLFNRRNTALCKGCNIVIIDIDSLRKDGLSCFGSIRDTSPNICRFFRNGFFFERNISQSRWTLPSIFSTMTSLYPFKHGVYTLFQDYLPPEIPTIATVLKDAGYQTVWAGGTGDCCVMSVKNGGLRGFKNFVSTPFHDVPLWKDIAEQYLLQGDSPSLIYFHTPGLHFPYTLSEGELPIDSSLIKPSGFPVTVEEFESSLADFLKNEYHSVFTEIAISEHPELFKNIKQVDKYAILDYYKSIDPDKNLAYSTARIYSFWGPVYDSFIRNIYTDDKENQRQRVDYFRMLYDTKIFSADEELSMLFELLDSPEISRNTIVILLSDHGEEFMEHGNFAHGHGLYNELLRTPLIIKIPGMDSGRTNDITENIDIFPTLIDAVGVPNKFSVQGNSLLPLMTGSIKPSNPKDFYAISFNKYQEISIQNSNWKLIADLNGTLKPLELYDLRNDQAEQQNIIESGPKIVDSLLKVLVDTVFKAK